jgi:hypothetical protein
MKKPSETGSDGQGGDEVLENVLQTLKKCHDFDYFVGMMEARARELSLQAPESPSPTAKNQPSSSGVRLLGKCATCRLPRPGFILRENQTGLCPTPV